MVCQLESKEKAKEVQDCILMAADISKRKTYRQIMHGVKTSICQIFCYSEVAILFYDQKGKKNRPTYFDNCR